MLRRRRWHIQNMAARSERATDSGKVKAQKRLAELRTLACRIPARSGRRRGDVGDRRTERRVEKRDREKADCEWRPARRGRREMSKVPCGARRMAGVEEVGERGWESATESAKVVVEVII